MTDGSQRGGRIRRFYLAPLAVLALGWLLSAQALVSVYAARRTQDHDRLLRAAARIEGRIQSTLTAYTHVLDSAAGYLSTVGRPTRLQWEAFSAAVDLPRNNPGIRGIGIAIAVDDSDLQRFAETMRSDGLPDFAIHAFPGENWTGPEHAIATFIDPSEANRSILGLDEFSEPSRRLAAAEARDTGQPTFSARVARFKSKSKPDTNMLFVPAFRLGAHPVNVAQRRAALLGWVFTPFVFSEILPAVLDKDPASPQLWFFEGPTPDPDGLLYAQAPGAAPPRFEALTQIQVAGRLFTLGWARGPGFIPSPIAPQLTAIAIAAAGTLLLAILIQHLMGRRWQLEREVALRTKELADGEKRLRTYVEQAADALYVTDSECRIVDVNQRACDSLGYSRQELLAMDIFATEAEADPERSRETFRRTLPGKPTTIFATQKRKDGTTFPVEVQCGAFEIDGAMLYLSLARDISERRQAEQALRESETRLRHAQKMEAVGQLAGGVAHDFNNILTAVNLNLSLLKASLVPGTQAAEIVAELGREADRAAALTRQLLFFSRRQAVRTVPVNLNDLVSNLLKMLGRLIGETVSIEWRPWPGLSPVNADPGMIEQVVMNLCVNARDAMPNGGSIVISTAQVEIGIEMARAVPEGRPGRFNRVTVEDTGCGMDDSVRQHLFEPFFTTKDQGKGTGLGLAIAYGIVKQHGGWIGVQSEQGRGSSFSVYLPVPEQSAVGSEDHAEHTPVAGRGETILLVEDEMPIRVTISMTLQRFGYQVLEAANGPEALRVWEQNRSRVRLVLSDVVMPGGVDGFALVARLRSQAPGLPAILMSGYVPELRPTRDAQIPFLAKPFGTDALLREVARQIRGRSNP